MAPPTRFERLAIQMELLVPVLQRLQARLGDDVVLDALRRDLQDRIEAAGVDCRAAGREADMARVEPGMAQWAEGGALEYDVVHRDEDRVGLDVSGCQYAALMERLGARDIGEILLCGEDHVGAAKVGLHLDRPHTHMQGHDVCDFRFSRTAVELSPRPVD